MARPIARLKLGFFPLPIEEARNIGALLIASAPYAAIDPSSLTARHCLRSLWLMKNAHERFGRLVYRRHTEKTATNLRVLLDAFVGEERGKAHLISGWR